jgi:hypothetical protein
MMRVIRGVFTREYIAYAATGLLGTAVVITGLVLARAGFRWVLGSLSAYGLAYGVVMLAGAFGDWFGWGPE